MLVYLPGRKWLEGNTLLGCILAVSFGVFLTNSISFIDPYPPHWELSHQAPLWHSIFVTGWLRRGFCNSFKSSMTMGCCNIIIYVLNIYIYQTTNQSPGFWSQIETNWRNPHLSIVRIFGCFPEPFKGKLPWKTQSHRSVKHHSDSISWWWCE